MIIIIKSSVIIIKRGVRVSREEAWVAVPSHGCRSRWVNVGEVSEEGASTEQQQVMPCRIGSIRVKHGDGVQCGAAAA